MSDDKYTLRTNLSQLPLPSTTAGRAAMLMELYAPPIYDECGCFVGYGEPLISRDDLLRLLDCADKSSDPEGT